MPKKKMRTRAELLAIPISEISEDNLPSDEELESLGNFPAGGNVELEDMTVEELCHKLLFEEADGKKD